MKALGRFSYDRGRQTVWFGTTPVAEGPTTHYLGQRLADDLQAELNCACQTERGRWKLATESTPDMVRRGPSEGGTSSALMPVVYSDGREGFAEYWREASGLSGWIDAERAHPGADVVMWFDVPAHPPIPKEPKCTSATASAPSSVRNQPTRRRPSPASAAAQPRRGSRPAATTRPKR